MSRFYKALATAIFSAIIFSCKPVSFRLLDTQISVDEKSAYYNAENIEIIFSFSMNTDSVEKLISLKKENSSEETEIVWQEKKCLIKPIGGFCLGCEYSFFISGEVLTSDGRTYMINDSRKFIFGNRENIFTLEKSIVPKDKESALELFFNKEIDTASFEREFKISPYTETKKEFAADRKSVSIVPADRWQNNTFYTWTVQNALSADKYRLNKTYSDYFMALNETARPKLICVCPIENFTESLDCSTALFSKNQDLSALFGKQAIGIMFDTPMDFESVKNSIYFEPSIAGVLLKATDNNFVYAPYDNYKVHQKYLMQIKQNAKDIFGLELQEQKNFYFTTSDDFLKINYITVDSTKIENSNIAEVNATADGVLFVEIVFSSELMPECAEQIQKAIKLGVFFPNTLNTPKLQSMQIFENRVHCQWNNLSSKKDNADCIYELKILGGKNYAKNKIGEYMEDDKCFYLRINQK